MDVEIQPMELKFKFQPNKQLVTILAVKNNSDHRVAYKIKTTAPKKYVVRPSSGVVEGKGVGNVQVIMQSQKEYPNDFQKDKFMVQTTMLKDDEALDKEHFQSGRPVKEHRLKVFLDGPALPPSPVPEVNEHEEEPTKSEPSDPRARTQIPASDLSSVSNENAGLRTQLERAIRERDELVKKLHSLSVQNISKGAAAAAAASTAEPAGSKISIIHMILVAILAFLIGHFMPKLM